MRRVLGIEENRVRKLDSKKLGATSIFNKDRYESNYTYYFTIK